MSPYTGADDAGLPEDVKALPDNLKAQWVEVWNASYTDCQSNNGTDCEKAAFAQAWGVVNTAKETAATDQPPAEDAASLGSKIKDFLAMLEKGLKDLLGIAEEAPAEEPPPEPPKEQSIYIPLEKERSVSFPAIYDQAYLQIQGQDQLAMMYDIYFDDNGLFAIVASNGKLFKIAVTVKDGSVSLGKWDEIMVTQARKPSFQIIRNKEGRYRWISISATAVLNRSGEIDSRQLFDNMIQRAEATGNYPIRDFFHAGQKFRTGLCDFLGRDENVLITSGLYDQSELAMREVKARLEEPDYWGDSITFYPMAPAQKIRAGNMEIPVYTDGILEAIATLPEKDAASWLTATPTLTEVQRMLSQRQMDAFVKLFGTKEEAEEWLTTNAAQRNKVIVDTEMITRAKRELAEVIADGVQETPVPDTTPEVPAEQVPALNADIIATIADQVVQRMDIAGTVNTALTPFGETINGLVSRVDALEAKFKQTTDTTTQTISQALTKLNLLDKTATQKKREWFDDLPEAPKPDVTFRPRSARDTERNATAEEALARVPVKY